MTCIVSETDGRTVTMAADSAYSGADNEIYTLSQPKIFIRGEYLFGVCGRGRVAQILCFTADLPDPPASIDLDAFLVRDLVPAIRQSVAGEGDLGTGRAILGDKTTILLGCRGRIWSIGSDLMVAPESPFAAIGSGRLRAYGALHALHLAAVEPMRRRLEMAMEAAMEAAAAYTSNVRPPWYFLSLGPGSCGKAS